MAGMTESDKMLWDYVDEESDALLIRMRDMVRQDGYQALLVHENTAVETIALKVLSAAMIKTLAIICETVGKRDLMQAYVEMSPMHAELLKEFMLREAGL